MAVKLSTGKFLYWTEVKKMQRGKREVLETLFATSTGIKMLRRLTIKATISWLGFKWSMAMTFTMKALYKNDRLFNNKLKIFGNITVFSSKSNFQETTNFKD